MHFPLPKAAIRRAAPLLLALLLAGCGGRGERFPMGERIRNSGELVSELRSGLRGHARKITISFDYGSDIYAELNDTVGLWVEAALEETEDPAEGDYIRYQYGGYTYNSSYSVSGGRWHYRVELTPDYYAGPSQEEQASEAVAELLREFGFTRRTTDAEKLRTVYDWLCRNVEFDKIHAKNPHSHLKSTAYAALVLRTATCQGYCTALYRLLRECGISCRIVTGSAGGERHAWVIAEADGLYYNLDPTWDAGAAEYSCFLRGGEDFSDHVPDGKFRNGAFSERYPVAEESYRKEGTI